MIGAIVGDIVGSPYEYPAHAIKSKDFDLFSPESKPTDDSILTIATAEALLADRDFARAYRRYYARYPDAGYGSAFVNWAKNPQAGAYGSHGNGSAMRVGPVGFVAKTMTEALALAKASALISHDHPEGIKGAQAVAAAVFMARDRANKREIGDYVRKTFAYRVDRTLSQIRPSYGFDVSAQGSVPEAIIAFLESTSFEDAIRNAVSLGGDSDTIAAIAGSIADAAYGVPADLRERALGYLDDELRAVIDRFERR
jgi:ADP-ribosylglycohydrolase